MALNKRYLTAGLKAILWRRKMIDILELSKKVKGKRDKDFLELFYNHNFYLVTKNINLINSAYKVQTELNLIINRVDYSSDYIIKLNDKKEA